MHVNAFSVKKNETLRLSPCFNLQRVKTLHMSIQELRVSADFTQHCWTVLGLLPLTADFASQLHTTYCMLPHRLGNATPVAHFVHTFSKKHFAYTYIWGTGSWRTDGNSILVALLEKLHVSLNFAPLFLDMLCGNRYCIAVFEIAMAVSAFHSTIRKQDMW